MADSIKAQCKFDLLTDEHVSSNKIESCITMGQPMSLNKLLAALLAVIFVAISLVVALTWSVGRHILDADAYVTSLDNAGFFNTPYELIREGEIPTVGGLLLREGPLSVVSGPELEAIARELAPPNWLRAQIARAIRDLIDVAEERDVDQVPALVVSLREVKERVLGEPGDRALSIVVEALPVCAPDRAPIDLNSDTPVCNPPDFDLGSFKQRLKELLEPLVQRVPDTYRVNWQADQQDVLYDLQQAGNTIVRLRFVMLLLTALNIALLGLIWLLAVRAPAEWLRWTGIPLFLLGLLLLLVALLTPRVIAWGLDNQALWTEENVPFVIAQSLDAAIRDFSSLLFRPAQLLGFVLGIVGLLLMLVSPLFPSQRQVRPTPAGVVR
jgi:hypothetical protein